MQELTIKFLKNSKEKIVMYTEYQIFTGYKDKNGREIFTGDTIEYLERDGTSHLAEVKFSIERGAYLHWLTWHPFRTDIKYWFSDQKEYIEVMENK